MLRTFLLLLVMLAPCYGKDTPEASIGKKIVIVTGELEYNTAATLPAFAKKELAPRGFQITHVNADQAKLTENEFPNWQVLQQADLLILSLRRKTPPKAMLESIRAHLAAGKPLVGIRTASHSFDAKPADDAHASWPLFDDEILGMDYQNHYGKAKQDPTVTIEPVADAKPHPILTGLPAMFISNCTLYKNRPVGKNLTILLNGTRKEGGEVEPIAWVNLAENRRVFYTSLGGESDFAEPGFRKLLLNGTLWAMDVPLQASASNRKEP